jgi:hypothetical protein
VREREINYGLFVVIMMLVLLGLCATDKAPALDAAAKSGSVGFGESGLPEGESLGGGGGQYLLSEPGPLGAPQDLTDYNNTAIQTWGPIASTIQVQASQPGQPVQVFSVNVIETGDPFTPTYQLPSGTIVKSSLPPEELVFEELNDSHSPIVSWSGPNGTTDIYDGEILLTFVTTADAIAISSFLATHNLDVAFSWFRPDLVTGGNEIAWFQLEYDQQQFASFNAAYTYFSQQNLVAEAGPNRPFEYSSDYGGGPGTLGNIEPDDDLYEQYDSSYNYADDFCRFPKEVGSAFTTHVPLGPESGGQMSNQAIAVLDDGVWRQHEDLWVHSSGAPGSGLGNAGKISWVGVEVDATEIWFGGDRPAGQWYGNPNPEWEDSKRGNSLLSHGTRIAGEITAGTNNDPDPTDPPEDDEVSVAGVAPSVMVLPVRLYASEGNDGIWGFSTASQVKAINALYDHFKPWHWVQRIRVVNMSFGGDTFSESRQGILEKDSDKYDRLYVASAGNDGSEKLQYPAAYDEVLGVSGLWRHVNFDQDVWYDSTGLNGSGSNYYADNYETYPVSGIYDYWDPAGLIDYVAQSTSTPGLVKNPADSNRNPGGLYQHMNGTSACAPQVAGLAALLFARRSGGGSWRDAVWQHIVDTRDDSMIAGFTRPLAGVVDYEEALSTW